MIKKQCMKTFIFLLLLPLQLLAQTDPASEKDITGIWKGTVISRELNLPYELIITRQNGVLTGYSHTTFTVRGEEIVSVKKLVVKFKKDHIVIEDEDLLFNNFNEEAPKKIKQTNKVTLETSGKVWRLYGTFEARAPRMLKPAEGTVELEKKDDPADSKLYSKLGELNLSNTISFALINSDKQTATVAVVDKPVTQKTNASPAVADYGKRLTVANDTPALVQTIPSTPPVSASLNENTTVLVKQENTDIVITPPVVINASKRSGVVVNKPPSVKKNSDRT